MYGEDAIDYLKREGRFTDVEIPDIILLDLNIPKKNGLEVFANAYVIKPLKYNQFIETIKSLENFWLTIVKLPPKSDPST